MKTVHLGHSFKYLQTMKDVIVFKTAYALAKINCNDPYRITPMLESTLNSTFALQ